MKTEKNILSRKVGLLTKLILKMGPTEKIFGAEIGVWEGDVSHALLDRLPSLKMYCIDPYRPFDSRSISMFMYMTYEDWNDLYYRVNERLLPFGGRAILLRMPSEEAFTAIPDKLDFVFIDANHIVDAVRTDITVWEPMVRDGGLIAGHDCGNWKFPGVLEAVIKYAKDFGREPSFDWMDYIWWWYK